MNDLIYKKPQSYTILYKLIRLVGIMLLTIVVGVSAWISSRAANPPIEADLEVSHTSSPVEVIAGQSITLTIAITNTGPLTATGVILTDTMEGMVVNGALIPSQGECNTGQVISCTLGTILADQGVVITVPVWIEPSVISGTVVTSTVQATADVYDPTSPNIDIFTATVNARADISLEKSGVPEVVYPGDILTYILTIANAGPSQAYGVNLTDTIPIELQDPAYSLDDGETWGEWSGSLNLGTIEFSQTILIRSVVTETESTSLTNTARVIATTFDPDLENNEDSTTIMVGKRADLSIEMNASPNPVSVGYPLTYLITVLNLGPDDATNVVIVDNLPSNVTFISATASVGQCNVQLGNVECNLGHLNSGTDATATIVVVPRKDGTLVNQASVDTDQADPDPGNNDISLSILVKRVEIFLPVVLRDTVVKERLLYDYFNTDRGWALVPDYTGEAGIIEGEYYLRSTTTNQIVNSVSPLDYLPTQFSIEADARRTEGTDTRYGIVFNWLDLDNFYVFFINPENSSYALYKYQSGWTGLVPWATAASIKQGNATNHLKVERDGSQIKLYANNVLLVTYSDTSITNGQAGLQLWGTSDLPAEAKFDNFMVWSYPDDFSWDRGWALVPDYTGEAGIIEGEYYLRSTTTNQIVNSVSPLDYLPTQFSIEVDARRTQGTDTRYGIVFNWLDLDNFYVFFINPENSSYALYKYQSGWTGLVSWTTAASIKQGDATNHLKVERDGSQIRLYANNVLLVTFNDTSITNGQAGLQLWGTSDLPAEVRFDNYWVLP
jgi:uncharacterized repeat protein (TIGR01451 family)